jgi:hypothetical protein
MSETTQSPTALVHFQIPFKNSTYCVVERLGKHVGIYIPNDMMKTLKGNQIPMNEKLEVALYNTKPIADGCPIHFGYIRK